MAGVFSAEGKKLLSTRAGGSDPIKQKNEPASNKLENVSNQTQKTAKSKNVNVIVNAQSLALKEQTNVLTYQFGVTFEEWEAKKKRNGQEEGHSCPKKGQKA